MTPAAGDVHWADHYSGRRDVTTRPDPDETTRQRLRRSEHVIGLGRLLVGVWAAVEWLWAPSRYPSELRPAAGVFVILLLLGGVLLYGAHRRIRTLEAQRRFGVAAYAFDLCLAFGVLWALPVDPTSSTWTIVILIALEAAVRFEPVGALRAYLLIAVGFVVVGRLARPDVAVDLDPWATAFRMVLFLLVIVIVAGLRRNLTTERQQLQAAVEQLERVEAWRERLIAVLAHDIRSPLGTVSGNLSLLDERRYELDQATTQRLLESSARQVRRVELLARDLLDLARTENGQLVLHTEVLDVASLLAEVTAGLPVTMTAPADLQVEADPARLEQILFNLLHNAVKHGTQPIMLEASFDRGDLVLVVEDRGPGIPDQQRPTLFEAFTPDAERPDSVGLGLWIVRRLTEAHGGTVRYDDASPNGARFTVRIPKASIREPAGTGPSAGAAAELQDLGLVQERP